MTESNSKQPRLAKLKITKFRAIGSAEIDFSETIALVGQNGSGKTSILRALNAFFNFEAERGSFEDGSHRFKTGTQSVIEVTMTGLEESGLPLSNPSIGEVRAELKYRAKPTWRIWTNGSWSTMNSDFHPQLRQHLSFALIPIRRDHEVAHESSVGLLEKAIEHWIASNHQRDRKSPQIANIANDLRSRSLSGLERHLQTIAPMSGPFSFELEYSTTPDIRLLLQNLRLSVKEGGQLIPLGESGSGTQSMAVFALYAYLAELQNTNYILGMEEPEQNLHPQAQQQLMRNLGRLNLQTVFTTHSPTIVDTLKHENVVLCRRKRTKQRELEVSVTQIRSDFFTAHGIDQAAYYKFHERRNSDFLFADFVVVAESPIDSAIISQLLTESGNPAEDLGVSLVSLGGVVSLPLMYALLKELQIPAAFVVDKDYLVPYKNNNVRKDSLDAQGYPRYAAVEPKRSFLPTLFPKDKDRNDLIRALIGNHTKAMSILETVNFFCFRYSLEVDLVSVPAARAKLYGLANLPHSERNEATLLKKRSKVLKDQALLLEVCSGIPAPNLPNSYRRIRSRIPTLARNAREL